MDANATGELPESLRGVRVLLGLSGSAGQPGTIARALRGVGVEAESLQINASKFGYATDRVMELSTDPARDMTRLTAEVAETFGLVHLHARTFLYTDNKRATFPHALDLLLLRAAGVRIVFHYRGSEIRLHSRFREVSPFHYVDEDPEGLVSSFPESSMLAVRDFTLGVADRVLVPDPELATYVPGAGVVPRAIELEKWEPCVPDAGKARPLVVHAPSRRVVKGTASVLAAVEALRAKGLEFDFQLVEGMSNEEAGKCYRRADVIVDQLRIGWYGVLAVEGMALGKPVVSYIRPDLVHELVRESGDEPPLAVADPGTLAGVLEGLIVDGGLRARLGARGRAFCERVHGAGAVARQLVREYDCVMRRPARFDVRAACDYLWYQQEQTRRMMKVARRSVPTTPLGRLSTCLKDRGVAWTLRRLMDKAGAGVRGAASRVRGAGVNGSVLEAKPGVGARAGRGGD